jgi:hypothetical protein
MKQILNKDEKEDSNEDYPEDHYITFVRKAFVMDKKEIEHYNTYEIFTYFANIQLGISVNALNLRQKNWKIRWSRNMNSSNL